MAQSSLGMAGDIDEEDATPETDALPASADQRESDSIQSPNFQLAAKTNPVEDATKSADATSRGEDAGDSAESDAADDAALNAPASPAGVPSGPISPKPVGNVAQTPQEQPADTQSDLATPSGLGALQVGAIPGIQPVPLLHQRLMDPQAEAMAEQQAQGMENQQMAQQLAGQKQAIQKVNASEPYVGDDGRWKKQLVDPQTGNINEHDVVDSGFGKTDLKTGNIFINTVNGPQIVGVDPQQKALAQTVNDKALAQVQGSQATVQIAAAKQDLLAATQQIKAFPEAARMRAQVAKFSLAAQDPNNTDAQDQLQQATDEFNAWKGQNPLYNAAVLAQQNTQAKIQALSAAKVSAQARVADALTAHQYVQVNGNLPPGYGGQPSGQQSDDAQSPTDVSGASMMQRAGEIQASTGLPFPIAQSQALAEAKNNGTQTVSGADIGQSMSGIDLTSSIPKMTPAQLRTVASSGLISKQDAVNEIQRRNTVDPNADNGVGGLADFGTRVLAKNSEMLNRAGEGISRFVQGDGDLTNYFKGNADLMKELGQGKWGSVNPSKNDSISAAVANALGTVTATIPAAAATAVALPETVGAGAVGLLARGGLIGIRAIPIATQFASSASADAFDDAKSKGASDKDATTAAGGAALKTLQALPAYMLAGGAASAVERAFLPAVMNPVARGAAHFILNGGANMVASAALRASNGEPIAPDKAGVAQDLAFALEPSLHEAIRQGNTNAYTPVAQDIMAGTDPEFAKYNRLANDPSADPKLRAIAQASASKMQEQAGAFLAQTKQPQIAPGTKNDPDAQNILDLHAKAQDLRSRIQTAFASGAPDAQAQLATHTDDLQDTEGQLHQATQAMTARIPSDLQARIAKMAAPDVDWTAASQQNADNPNSHFATENIGSKMRDQSLSMDQQRNIRQVAISNGADPNIADHIANQALGAKTVNDIGNVLRGGNIDANSADALKDQGMLTPSDPKNPAAPLHVTEEAKNLLASGLQNYAVKRPDVARYSPGETAAHGDALYQHSVMGMDNFAKTAQRMIPPKIEAQPEEEQPNLQEGVPPSKEAGTTNIGDVLNKATSEAPERSRGDILKEIKQRATELAKEKSPDMQKALTGRIRELNDQLDESPQKSVKGEPIDESKLTDSQLRLTGEVRKEFMRNKALMDALGIKAPAMEGAPGTSGLHMSDEGELKLDPRAMEADISKGVGPDSKPLTEIEKQSLLRARMREEVTHRIQILAEGGGDKWRKTYADLRNDPDLDPALVELARKSYVGFDKLSKEAQGAELVRMVLDAKWHGTITERIFKAIQGVVSYLRGLNIDESKSQLFKEIVARAEKVRDDAMAKMREGSKEEESLTPSKEEPIAKNAEPATAPPEVHAAKPSGRSAGPVGEREVPPGEQPKPAPSIIPGLDESGGSKPDAGLASAREEPEASREDRKQRAIPENTRLVPERALHSLRAVQIKAPEGATSIRATDTDGRQSIQPIREVNKGLNPFHEVGPFSKIEAGTIGKDKKFQPVPGEVEVYSRGDKQALGASKVDTGAPEDGETPMERLAREAEQAGVVFKSGELTGMIRGDPKTMEAIRAKIKARTGNDALFASKTEDAEPFYSQLSRTVESLPQETMTVGQATAAISKGVKSDEVKMSGILTDPLSPLYGKQPNDKVTKEQLRSFAIEREAKVQDVTLSDNREKKVSGYYSSDERWGEAAKFDSREDAIKAAMDMFEEPVKDKYGDVDHYKKMGRQAAEEFVDETNEEPPMVPETHFSQYQLPGGDPGSYREQFVTWPKDEGRERTSNFDSWFKENYGDQSDYDANQIRVAKQEFGATSRASVSKNWEDGHSDYSDIANPIVRLRRNVRTDTNGNRTLFLEEMQGPSDENQSKMPPELRKRIYEIGMKRAMREASEEGATHLGWTTGADQAARYSLDKQVALLSYNERDNRLTATSHDGTRVIDRSDVPPEKLEAYIGKDPAKNIMAQEPERGIRTLSGEGLKVGGEGLKRLYDETLPRIANDIGKKFGAKAGTSTIETGIPKTGIVDEDNLSDEEWKSALKGKKTIHSIELPPALRSKATEEGFPLFASKASEEPSEAEKSRDDIASKLTPQAKTLHDDRMAGTVEEGKEMAAENVAKHVSNQMQARGISPEEAARALRPKDRPYINVPDSLMGFAKNDPQKGYDETNFPHEQPVRATWPDGDSIVDQIKGMNKAHAIERARRNWPTAKIEEASHEELAEQLKKDSLAASPIASARAAYDKSVDALADESKRIGSKNSIAAKVDAVGNRSNITAGQAASSIRLDLPNPKDREAMPFVIEAGKDPKEQMNNLLSEKAKIASSNDPKLAKKWGPVIDKAISDFNRLNPLRKNYDRLISDHLAEQKREGVAPGEVDDYVTRKLNQPEQTDKQLFEMGNGSGSASKYYAKGRVFETLGDAIHAGYDPKSTDLADLAQHRIEAGEKVMGQKRLFKSLETVKSPVDGMPIIGKEEERPKIASKAAMADYQKDLADWKAKGSVGDPPDKPSHPTAIPKGYQAVNAGGARLIVHDAEAPIFKDLYGDSALRRFAAGRLLLKAAAGIKGYTLLGDTFHVGRVLYKMAASGGGLPTRIVDGKPEWNLGKGRALVEYGDKDLQRAVSAKEITQKDADFARANRSKFDKLVSAGMNVGKASDNLMEQAHANLPGLNGINKWIFGKLSRSAMVQSSFSNLERNLANPRFTQEQAYRQTAKEMNETFGNLQNQGVFKDKTLQDLSRLIFLAPQWTESQLRAEGRAYGQAGKSALDAVTGKGLRVGNATRIFAGGFAAMLAANQVVNMLTRGQTTFQNKEDGRQFSAYIPGGRRGFFFDPLEIAGQYSWAAHRYLAQHQSPVDSATRIMGNKLSPLARATQEALSGRGFDGKHFLSDTDRYRSAASNLVPMPIGASGLVERDPRQLTGFRVNRQPGSIEKQAASSIGLKMDPAQSPAQAISNLAQPFRASRQGGDTTGEFTQLRQALDNRDASSARSEIEWLQKNQGKTPDAIAHAVGIRKDGSVSPELFTGNKDSEQQFLKSLSPDHKSLYQQAQQDHQVNARFFRMVMASMKNRQS